MILIQTTRDHFLPHLNPLNTHTHPSFSGIDTQIRVISQARPRESLIVIYGGTTISLDYHETSSVLDACILINVLSPWASPPLLPQTISTLSLLSGCPLRIRCFICSTRKSVCVVTINGFKSSRERREFNNTSSSSSSSSSPSSSLSKFRRKWLRNTNARAWKPTKPWTCAKPSQTDSAP